MTSAFENGHFAGEELDFGEVDRLAAAAADQSQPSQSPPVAPSPYPDATVRWFITISVMAATVMNSLDSTIANVALPHIQGSVAASADEITWVLTSYIVASAICTPLTGWLAGRFGRKRLMVVSIIGFTLVSGLCGIADSLGEIVGFRLLQGMFGAALVPMSQAVLLDINPPERHASAMSIWSMGAVLGPIVGPALGGWLTDDFSWRWVFFHQFADRCDHTFRIVASSQRDGIGGPYAP